MRRKWIPPFLMLFAGAVSSIIMFLLHYETKSMLMILIGVLVGFYIVGCLFKWMLDVFERQNEEKAAEEVENEAELAEGEMPDMEEGQVKTEG